MRNKQLSINPDINFFPFPKVSQQPTELNQEKKKKTI